VILASTQTCQGGQERTIEITCEVANAAEHVTSALSIIILGGRDALLAYSKAVLEQAVAWLPVSRIITECIPAPMQAYVAVCRIRYYIWQG